MPSPAITGMAKQRFGPEVPVDAGGSSSDRLVGVSRASTIGRCVPPNCRGGLTGATAADSRRYDAHGRVKSERWEPRDRTPNPRTKRERVSRSRCAELRKHAQHESLGAHRFRLYYTVTRHKTCHVSGGYISAAIRARRKNVIYATCSAPLSQLSAVRDSQLRGLRLQARTTVRPNTEP